MFKKNEERRIGKGVSGWCYKRKREYGQVLLAGVTTRRERVPGTGRWHKELREGGGGGVPKADGVARRVDRYFLFLNVRSTFQVISW